MYKKSFASKIQKKNLSSGELNFFFQLDSKARLRCYWFSSTPGRGGRAGMAQGKGAGRVPWTYGTHKQPWLPTLSVHPYARTPESPLPLEGMDCRACVFDSEPPLSRH